MPTTEEYVAQVEATLRRFSSATFVLQASITPEMRGVVEASAPDLEDVLAEIIVAKKWV